MASTDNKSLTEEGLKTFEGFKTKTDLVRVYVEAAGNFTKEELKEFTATFVKYDVNKSGDLDEFELNKMYESRGEAKTSSELRALIKSIGDEFGASIKQDGVTFASFLSILLKDKKGVHKTEWGTFTKVIKKHDDSTKRGKLANFFEQEASKQTGDDERIKADLELRKTHRKMIAQEKERKKAKKEAIAQFQSNINNK